MQPQSLKCEKTSCVQLQNRHKHRNKQEAGKRFKADDMMVRVLSSPRHSNDNEPHSRSRIKRCIMHGINLWNYSFLSAQRRGKWERREEPLELLINALAPDERPSNLLGIDLDFDWNFSRAQCGHTTEKTQRAKETKAALCIVWFVDSTRPLHSLGCGFNYFGNICSFVLDSALFASQKTVLFR